MATEPLVTANELELVALYASGDDMPTIARKKYLSPRTVENNLARAKKRAGAKSLTNLCVMLVDSGLLRKNGTGYKPVQDERVVG